MKTFDYKKVLAGTPVITRGGVCVLAVLYAPTSRSDLYPLVAVLCSGDVYRCTMDGDFNGHQVHNGDLMLDEQTDTDALKAANELINTIRKQLKRTGLLPEMLGLINKHLQS